MCQIAYLIALASYCHLSSCSKWGRASERANERPRAIVCLVNSRVGCGLGGRGKGGRCVPAERREQASGSVPARHGTRARGRWDLFAPFLFYFYFHLQCGAWRVRGINIFGRFLDSLNFFFSFVGLLLLLLYKSVIVIVLLFHLFFPKGISPAHNTVISAPFVVTPAARRHPRQPPTHSFSTFVTGGPTFFVASRKSYLHCPGIGITDLSEFRICYRGVCWIRLQCQMRRAQFCRQPATHHSAAIATRRFLMDMRQDKFHVRALRSFVG